MNDAIELFRKSGRGLDPNLLEELASAVFEDDPETDEPTQLGWLTVEVRVYNGWELWCVAGGKEWRYFVPDTSAAFVGPRLTSVGKVATIGFAAVAVLLLILGVFNHKSAARREREYADRVAEADRKSFEAEARRAEEQDRLRRLSEEVPAAIQQVEAALLTVSEVKGLDDITQKETEFVLLREGLRRFDAIQAPTELTASIAKLDAAVRVLRQTKATYAAVTEAMSATSMADQRVASADWVEADDLYARAITQWQTHPELMASIKIAGLDGKMAPVNVKVEVDKLQKKRQRIAGQVKQARAAIEAEEQRKEKERLAAQLRAAICGAEAPFFGKSSAEYHYKAVARDPDSVVVESCGSPRLLLDRCWIVVCDVRARNGFGGMNRNIVEFEVGSQGTLISWRTL